MKTIAQSTAVLIANSFNIPIFQQVWLVDNGIFDRNDFIGETLFSPVAVNIPHKDYDFLAVPERVQVRTINNHENAGDLFKRIIVGISSALPHTPFQALGLNVDILIQSENDQKLRQNARDVFMPSIPELNDLISNGDERFGSYISQDIFNCRMRIDIKPVIRDGKEQIILAFNFHREIRDLSDISDAISKWDELFGHANKFSDILNERLEA